MAFTGHYIYAGGTAHPVYQGNGDIMGGNYAVMGGQGYVESQDLTNGEQTTRLGRLRFVRGGHTYGGCTSTRYSAAQTAIFDTGYTNGYIATPYYNGTNTYNGLGGMLVYSQRFAVNTGANMGFYMENHIENGSYPYGCYIDLTGPSGSGWTGQNWVGWATNGATSGWGTVGQGIWSFTLRIYGQNSGGYNNYGRIVIYNAQ